MQSWKVPTEATEPDAQVKQNKKNFCLKLKCLQIQNEQINPIKTSNVSMIANSYQAVSRYLREGKKRAE